MDKIKVNDGGGLLDSDGMCNKGITLCNSAIQDLVSGQYLLFVNKIEQIAQIFKRLETGIKNDRESLQANIEELKRMNDALLNDGVVPPEEKEGAE